MSALNKAELREAYTQKRQLLSAGECEERSRAIAEEFYLFPLAGVRLLHLFYPIPGKKEVDTLLIADWISRHYPAIRLVLPKSDPSDHSLKHILWNDTTPLAMNSWGITEPVSGREVPAGDIDMVLVPLLAFDRKGNRVGYGKGFYDRFLESCRPDAIKVGLSFFGAEELLETNATDVRLNACITPGGVYRF